MKYILTFLSMTFLFSSTAQLNYKTYMSTIPDFKERFPYFDSNDPEGYLAWDDTIVKVVRNNKRQIIQLTVRVNPYLMTGGLGQPPDSLKLYTFRYNAQDKLEQVIIRYRTEEPAYCVVYDTDIHFSQEQQLYDDKGRRCGYRRYADSILIEERCLAYDAAGYTISDYIIHEICEMRDSISDQTTYSYCAPFYDTIFRASYQYSDDYRTIERISIGNPDEIYKIPAKPLTVQLYRFNRRGDLLEKSTFDKSHPEGKRMVIEYNDRGKLLSYRFCDTNYRLIPESSRESFAMMLYVYNRTGRKCQYIVSYDLYGRALEISYGPDHWKQGAFFDRKRYVPQEKDLEPGE